MTIDYVEDENRLAAILEAGEWLIDQAVERAIRRNTPKPPMLPPLDDASKRRQEIIESLPPAGSVVWMKDAEVRQLAAMQAQQREQHLHAAWMAQNALNQQRQSMYNAGIGSLFGGEIPGWPLGSLFR